MAFPPTDWLDWTTAEYEVGAPATSLSFERWFRNPVALAQGVPGAPRISIGALQRISAGNEIRSRLDSERMSGSGDPIAGFGFSFMQAGSVRATFTFRNDGPDVGKLAYLYRIRNGVSTTLWSGAYSTSNQTVTVDVSVLPGDRVYPYFDTNRYVYLSNERYMTNGEDLYPGNSTPLEGNTYNA